MLNKILTTTVIFFIIGCGGGTDAKNSINNLGNSSNYTEIVGGEEIRDIDIEPMNFCMKVGDVRSFKVMGDKVVFDRNPIDITGSVIVNSLDTVSLDILSHNNDAITIQANLPVVTKLEVSIGSLKDSAMVGIVPSYVELPVIMKKGCSFVYYSKGNCGIALNSKKRGINASGSGFTIQNVRVGDCQVLKNSSNVPVIEIDN